MLTGLNTAIDYQGESYHVQTEDGGASRPVVTTVLFKGGAVFLSRKTPYGHSPDPEPVRSEEIKKLMKEQHKMMLKDLVAGKIPLPTV
jgi:hypothetical protein